MSTRIVFNGKEYASVEEMPLEVRRAYEQVAGLLADRDGDGIPDFAQGGSTSQSLTITRTRFVHDGKVYSSVEEMPPEARRHYQEAVSQLGDASRAGIPDMLGSEGTKGSIEEDRHIVVRTAQSVQSEPRPSLLFSMGTSFLLAALAALVGLAVLVLWKLV